MDMMKCGWLLRNRLISDMSMKRRSRRIVLWMLGLFLVAYVDSYLVLSRRGMSVAEQHRMNSFYYLPVSYLYRSSNSLLWERVEIGLRYFYEPLNTVDVTLGTGMTHDGSI